MNTQPDWSQLADQLIDAAVSTANAFEKTRRRRYTISAEDQRRMAALLSEKNRYIREARKAIEQSATSSEGVVWRSLVTNLLRAHSIAWELLWIEYESGIPFAIESGQFMDGRCGEADRYIDEALRALAATEPQFSRVEWDGREVLHLVPQRR